MLASQKLVFFGRFIFILWKYGFQVACCVVEAT